MRTSAIVFDLGNTLLPWRDHEQLALFRAVRPVFEEVLGPRPDYFERAERARDALIREREATTLREVTMEEFVHTVCDGAPADGLCERVTRTFADSFIEICRMPPATVELLHRLNERMPLAVLSNFVLEQPIHEVLRQAGVHHLFAHVEVSAASGYMKPHPLPFEIVRDRLGLPAEELLMVGDNFWADVVGGHRVGFQTALTHEFVQGPTADPRAPGVRANRVLQALHELDGQS